MITSEQVVEYLIMIDLQRKCAENKLNAEGLSALLDLQSDKKLKEVEIVDVLDYTHAQEEEIKEYNNYFKSFGCKNFTEFQELIGLTKISANDKERDDAIRKQVCDEIREEAHNYMEMPICENCGESFYDSMITSYDLKAILDQIEKGERK